MKKTAYIKTSGYLFAFVGALHLLRILSAWPANVGTWNVPMWISWLLVAIPGTWLTTLLGLNNYKTSASNFSILR